MTESQAIETYQRAVDRTMGIDHGAEWWGEVAAEFAAVVKAPTVAAGGALIAWWQNDWRQFNDTPARTAGRIRKFAVRVLNS